MIKSCASLLHFRTDLVTKGDAQPCPFSPISTNSSTRTHATPISIRSDGKIAPCNVPGVTVTTSIRGGSTTTDRGDNATVHTDASAPSRRRSVREVPRPTGVQTLLVQRLKARLHRPHQHPAPPEPAVAAALHSD